MRTFTPEQTAEVLQLSVRTVYDLLRKGKLPGRKIGGRKWRVAEEELSMFVRVGRGASGRRHGGHSSVRKPASEATTKPEEVPFEEYARRKREEILEWARQQRRVQRKSALGIFADVEGLSSEEFARRKQEEIELENRCWQESDK